MINQLDKVDGWYLQRYSKFTASEIHKLIGKGKDGTGFSVGGMTYIETKAIEEMTVMYERPELEFVESLMHGKAYEEPAFRAYVKVSRNTSMKHFGSDNPVYLPYNDYSGGSPDGLMGEVANIKCGLEIKCPKNPANHFKYLKMSSQWDLKEIRPEYYAQIQFLLMITQAEGFHFVSYDERFINPSKKIHIIDVLPDTKFQDNLELRIASAQKEKIKILEKYN